MDGRRVLLSRGRVVCEAVTPEVARRIAVCLRALSGLEIGPRIGSGAPGAVARILAAADEVVARLEEVRHPLVTYRALRAALSHFFALRADLVCVAQNGEAAAEEEDE